ncbi:MAG: ankyrin repeat domain-containing protein [Holosporaceae bacterium]|jgi:hypothetical protein|nr:ankyrin repeat domain-containing protein [Holosporaceae bacterium]
MRKTLAILAMSILGIEVGWTMETTEFQESEINKSQSYIISIVEKAGLDDNECDNAKEFVRKLCFGSMSEQVTIINSARILLNSEESNSGIILAMAYMLRAIESPFIEYRYRKQIALLCMPIGNIEYFDLCRNIYKQAQKKIHTKDNPAILKSFCEADDLLRAEAQYGNKIAQYIFSANLIKLSQSISKKHIDDDDMSGYLAMYSYIVERLQTEVQVDGSTFYNLPTLIASFLINGNMASYEVCVEGFLKDMLLDIYGENHITSNAFAHLGKGMNHLLQKEDISYLNVNADDNVNVLLAQRKAEYNEYQKDINDNLAAIAPVVRRTLVPYVFFPEYAEKYNYTNQHNELLECLSSKNIPFIIYDINNYYFHSWHYGTYPLFLAAAYGKNLNLLIRLLNAKADTHLISTIGEYTALHMAINTVNPDKNDRILKIIKILAMVCDINAEDFYGDTAFERACKHSWFDVAELLLDMSAKVKIDFPSSKNFLKLWSNRELSDSFRQKALEANRKFVAREDGRIEEKSLVKGFAVDDNGEIFEQFIFLP